MYIKCIKESNAKKGRKRIIRTKICTNLTQMAEHYPLDELVVAQRLIQTMGVKRITTVDRIKGCS